MTEAQYTAIGRSVGRVDPIIIKRVTVNKRRRRARALAARAGGAGFPNIKKIYR